MEILNQFSYVVSSLIILFGTIGVAFAVIHRQTDPKRWPLISSFVFSIGLILFSGFFALRPGVATVDTLSEVEEMLANNRPTLLQFYSNYCIGCMSVEGELDALETQISTTHDILRVDIHTDFGRELREELDFNYTPEFVLFNPGGQEIWRGHELPPSELIFSDRSTATTADET